jgi:hypothetical protein
MVKEEKLIKKTASITQKNYEFLMEQPGVSYSDKLRRLLDKIEDGDTFDSIINQIIDENETLKRRLEKKGGGE